MSSQYSDEYTYVLFLQRHLIEKKIPKFLIWKKYTFQAT